MWSRESGKRKASARREAETRGAGPVERVDAFRARVRGAVPAAIAVAALAVFAVAAALFDLGQARQTGDAWWLAPAGVLLLPVAAALGWVVLRRPVVLTVGPEGLYQPIAWSAPLPWRDVWRMRCVRQKTMLRGRSAVLAVDLSPGATIPYKRWAQTVPALERWLIRTFGLRVPLHHLDAEPGTALASVERFRPVAAVSK